MLRIFSSLLIVLSLATLSEAQMYFVHGVDGREVGSPKANPYDLILNGNCVLKGINYLQVSAPMAIAAGHYLAEVRYSNGSCTGTVSLTGSFDVALHESLSVVAQQNEQGVPSLVKFSNDPRYTPGAKARLVFRQTAGIEPVQVRLRRLTKGSASTYAGYLPIIRNGEQQTVELNPGKYETTYYSTVGYRQKFATSQVTLTDNKLLAVYTVGSFKGKSFDLILQTLDTVNQ